MKYKQYSIIVSHKIKTPHRKLSDLESKPNDDDDDSLQDDNYELFVHKIPSY